jgi:alpha-1,6-mannosyltransferase
MNAQTLRCLACPILSALIYVTLSSSGDITTSVTGYALSFLPYLWLVSGLRRTPKTSISQCQILGSLVITGTILLLAAPILSEDIWRYVWDGFSLASGTNPYCVAPSSPSMDQFSQRYQLQTVRASIGHAQLPTIYPPLAQAIFSVSSLFTPSTIPIRVLGGLAIMCSAILLFRLLKWRGINPSLVVLFVFNPLVLVEVYVSGHVDIFAVMFVLGAFYLAQIGRHSLSACLLACAVLTKVIPILIIPVVLKRRWKQWGLCLTIISCVYLLFSMSDCSPLGSLSTFSGKWRHNDGMFGALHWFFEQGLSNIESLSYISHTLSRWLTGTSQINTPGLVAMLSTKLMCLSLVLAFYLWLRRTDWNIEIKALSLFAFFFTVSPVVHPWYLIWILPILPYLWSINGLASTAPLIWWSISSLVAYEARIELIINGRWHTPVELLWLEYGVLGCLCLWSIRFSSRARPRTQ